MLTHSQCKELKFRNGQHKLENNTVLVQRGEDFAVVLHATDVVTIHADGTFTLNNGGWATVTSKDRINGYSPANVYAEKRVWYIQKGHGAWSKENRVPFVNGVRVDENGFPLNVNEQGEFVDTVTVTVTGKRKPKPRENSLLTAGVYVG